MSESSRSRCFFRLLQIGFLSLALFPKEGNAAQFTEPSRGYTITYPDAWEAQPHPSAGGAILRNFPWMETLHGGSPPFGGAIIALSVFPPYPRDWPPDADEYNKLEAYARLLDGESIVLSTRQSGGPARVEFSTGTIAGPTDKHVVLAIRKAGRLFYIGLQYQKDDPNGPAYEQTLSDTIASITILDATPAPTPATSPLRPTP
jgi:hypothetical protein